MTENVTYCDKHVSSWKCFFCSAKGANGPGPGKVAPVGIPCVRPQSDIMCYMLDRCGIESGS